MLAGIGIGIALTVVGIAAATLFGSFTARIGFVLLLGIGVAQVLWILPAFLYFQRRGQRETAKGILIVAGICLLLNASCWGVFATGHFRIGG